MVIISNAFAHLWAESTCWVNAFAEVCLKYIFHSEIKRSQQVQNWAKKKCRKLLRKFVFFPSFSLSLSFHLSVLWTTRAWFVHVKFLFHSFSFHSFNFISDITVNYILKIRKLCHRNGCNCWWEMFTTVYAIFSGSSCCSPRPIGCVTRVVVEFFLKAKWIRGTQKKEEIMKSCGLLDNTWNNNVKFPRPRPHTMEES